MVSPKRAGSPPLPESRTRFSERPPSKEGKGFGGFFDAFVRPTPALALVPYEQVCIRTRQDAAAPRRATRPLHERTRRKDHRMNINNVSFERSFGNAAQLPPSTYPEIVFAGRSNVGKSSLLNKLFNRKELAKVSNRPGKTATINFFLCDDVRFVDLPGYGYAKVAKSEFERWAELIEGYLTQDRNFALVITLVDIRLEAQDLDVMMLDFLREAELPYAVVLTKADKISKQQQQRQKALLKKQLRLSDDVPLIVSSSEKGTGIDEIRSLIQNCVR